MKNIKAFTLIETIVVIAVIGMALPVIFAIFFVLLQQQTKIYRLNTVKKEGDYTISLIQNTIKNNAVTIISSPIPPDDTNKVCALDASTYTPILGLGLYFLDKDGSWFGYVTNNRSVASDSANLTTAIDLTSLKTLISNFSMSCSRTNTFSPPSVSLSFDICFIDALTNDCSQTRPEEVASLHYQTRIKLRNY